MEDDSTIDINTFIKLDDQNSLCADCRKESSLFASINNGILICRYCAKRHQQLGYNISYIREIADKWDDYLLSFIQRGGNSRFIRFSNDYRLYVLSIESKYKTKAAEYYRKLILSEVSADKPPEFVDKKLGMQYYSRQILFSEFANYQLFKGEKMPTSEQNIIIKGGSTLFNALINNGGYLYNQSKSAAWFVTTKTTNGFFYVYSKIVNCNEEIINDTSKEVKESSPQSQRIDDKQKKVQVNQSPIQNYCYHNKNYNQFSNQNNHKNIIPLLYQPNYQNHLDDQYKQNYPNDKTPSMPALNIINNNFSNNKNEYKYKNDYKPLLIENSRRVNNCQIENSKPEYNKKALLEPSNEFPDFDLINNSYLNDQSKDPKYIVNPYTQSTPIDNNISSISLLDNTPQGQCQKNDSSITNANVNEQQKPNEIAQPQICCDKSTIINDSEVTLSHL